MKIKNYFFTLIFVPYLLCAIEIKTMVGKEIAPLNQRIKDIVGSRDLTPFTHKIRRDREG